MHYKTTCSHTIPTAEVVRFLVVTIVLGFALQLVAVRVGVKSGGMFWLGMTMWAPAVGALLAGPVARARVWASLRRSGFRYFGAALVIGFAPRLLQTGILLVTGWGQWDSTHFELTESGGAVAAVHEVAMVLGVGEQSFPYFAVNLAITIVLSAAVIALMGGVGEEIGWRGVLQPGLEQRFGAVWGTLLVGLIWAYWHLPANLSGYNDGEHPVLNALLFFPMAVVAMSFSFAWLARKSGSVWPVALAHGANNTLGSAFLVGTDHWPTNTTLELVTMTGVALWVVWRELRDGRRNLDRAADGGTGAGGADARRGPGTAA